MSHVVTGRVRRKRRNVIEKTGGKGGKSVKEDYMRQKTRPWRKDGEDGQNENSAKKFIGK